MQTNLQALRFINSLIFGFSDLFSAIFPASFGVIESGEIRSLNSRTLHRWQFLDGLIDDVQCLFKLFFRDDQWWCEAYNVLVCWFCL